MDMRLVSELRRRNVLRMAVLYAITAWLMMQVAEVLIGLAALPSWMGPLVVAVLAIGFPIALIFAWVYEITPQGLKLEKDVDRSVSIADVTGRRMDFIAIAVLAAAVILFAVDKWWVGGPPEKSIAVLAFENKSGDPQQEYFSDGVSEEILNLLSQIPELRVISRSSSFSFKGKEVSIPEVAEQLNVAHVLEGSVRRMGDRMRITAQLVDAETDSHLWSHSFDRDIENIFAVQDEIAKAISEALKLKLAVGDSGHVLPEATVAADSEAYDAYLRGRELIHHRIKDDLQEAIGYLERSVSLNNSYAPAHAQLAIAAILFHGYGNEEARRIAARHLDRAQELRPGLAEAYAGRALMALHDDPESAVIHARKALAVNPSYIDAMTWLRIGLQTVGRDEEAHAVLERMLVSDPLSIIARMHYAGWLQARGRIEEAHDIADRIGMQSPSAGYRLHASISYWAEGDLADAVYWGLKSSLHNDDLSSAFLCVGEFDEARRIARKAMWIDVAEGRWDEAIQAAERQAAQNPTGGYLLADAAGVFYYARRFDEALPLYVRAFEFAPEGRPIFVGGNYYAMQLAMARRIVGDEAGARAAADMVRRGLAEREPNSVDMYGDYLEAMVAAFDHDADAAIAALRTAVEHGARWPLFFDDPVLEELQDDRRLVTLLEELETILAGEHEKILQLICFNNPVPDKWQPLPETCAGVVENQRL